jgi:deazaflavin-dependent oxidoreductase (nitroreductase family)
VTTLGSIQSGFLRIHQTIYEATRGTVGHRLIGVPTLLLTSTGRRTGSPRTAALVYAKDDDGALIVTASNGGADRRPGWLHNVKADASVEVRVGRRRFDGSAEVIGPEHTEYVRLWTLVNRNTRGRYDRYQQHTDRAIELVKLRPR